ncbi:hypothetical protein BDZ97DRAFT_1753428 [Flammula alnicola]|nr:hypothetical protein BDZ97DRAFT_1753428 [Flammula alnicola]
MYQRDPRSYAYDDQNTAYPSGHIPHQSADHATTGYHQHDGSSHYYVAPEHGIGGTNDRDTRYYSSQQGFGGPASASVSQPMYAPQNAPYPPQFLPALDERSLPLGHRAQPQIPFIPTPSEIANTYSNYPHQGSTPRSPTIPEDPYSSSLDYPAPPHMVPSSHASHRPSRLATGRPRTISAAATSERFPCEKCGKTFSRSHDRKRHHETQHTPIPVMHTCHHCQKEFSRDDPLIVVENMISTMPKMMGTIPRPNTSAIPSPCRQHMIPKLLLMQYGDLHMSTRRDLSTDFLNIWRPSFFDILQLVFLDAFGSSRGTEKASVPTCPSLFSFVCGALSVLANSSLFTAINNGLYQRIITDLCIPVFLQPLRTATSVLTKALTRWQATSVGRLRRFGFACTHHRRIHNCGHRGAFAVHAAQCVDLELKRIADAKGSLANVAWYDFLIQPDGLNPCLWFHQLQEFPAGNCQQGDNMIINGRGRA